jgi:hypothetical protein
MFGDISAGYLALNKVYLMVVILKTNCGYFVTFYLYHILTRLLYPQVLSVYSS